MIVPWLGIVGRDMPRMVMMTSMRGISMLVCDLGFGVVIPTEDGRMGMMGATTCDGMPEHGYERQHGCYLRHQALPEFTLPVGIIARKIIQATAIPSKEASAGRFETIYDNTANHYIGFWP